MDIAGIRQALHRQPFEPFSIRLTDGRAIKVCHPDYMAIAPSGLRLGAFDPDGNLWMLKLPMIAAIELSPNSHPNQ